MENIFTFNYSDSYSFYHEYSHNICIYDKNKKVFVAMEEFSNNHEIINIMNFLDSSESVEYNCLVFKKQEQFCYCTYSFENCEDNTIKIELTIHDKDFNFHDIFDAFKQWFNEATITEFHIYTTNDDENIITTLNTFDYIATLEDDEEKEKMTTDMFYTNITKEEIIQVAKLVKEKN